MDADAGDKARTARVIVKKTDMFIEDLGSEYDICKKATINGIIRYFIYISPSRWRAFETRASACLAF